MKEVKKERKRRIGILRKSGWYRSITGNYISPKREKCLTEEQIVNMPEAEFIKLLD